MVYNLGVYLLFSSTSYFREKRVKNWHVILDIVVLSKQIRTVR